MLQRQWRGTVKAPEAADGRYGVTGVGMAFGRYWSHHHRTEVSVSATTRGYTEGWYELCQPASPGCQSFGAGVQSDYRHELISLTQVVQIGRNRWVHPQVGLGATLDLEHRDSRLRPVSFTEGRPYYLEYQRALAAQGTRTRAFVRPFGLAALKVYFRPRAFLRAGLTVSSVGSSYRCTLQGTLGRDW